MPRQSLRPPADRQVDLTVQRRHCAACGGATRTSNKAYRTVATLGGLVRLGIRIRRCTTEGCARRGRQVRAEEEGAWVIPGHEFGLDVIATAGTLRHAQHRSVPEIHAELLRRGVAGR